MIEAWLARAAEHFWKAVGGPVPPPRDLTPLISRAFSLSVILISELDIIKIERWFAERNVPYRFLCQNRALCGCIIAARGHGMLFVDAHDTPEERRFTIAHEVAHFLIDYLAPRQEAIAVLGASILPVLDGERSPTAEERIHAVLGRVKLGLYQDMMPRSAQGSIDQGMILRAEDRADRMALELLAPAMDVLAAVITASNTSFERARAMTEILERHYGLPPVVAQAYATSLARQNSRPSIAEWLEH